MCWIECTNCGGYGFVSQLVNEVWVDVLCPDCKGTGEENLDTEA